MKKKTQNISVQFRITEILDSKIIKLESITGRTRSDLFRQSIENFYEEKIKISSNPYYGGSALKKEFKYEKEARIMKELLTLEDDALTARLKELGIFYAEWSKQYKDFNEYLTRGLNNERIWIMTYGGSKATQSESDLVKAIEKSEAFAKIIKE